MLAVALVGLAFAAPASANDVDIVGHHDTSDRIACVMVKRTSGATAVRCGAKGRSAGLLLGSSGTARRVAWEWRTDRPDIDHHAVRYGQTLYFSGVTAKREGDASMLRCTFLRSPSIRVRCRNRDGHEIVVTRTSLVRR